MSDKPRLIDNWRRLRAQINALPQTLDPDIAEWVRPLIAKLSSWKPISTCGLRPRWGPRPERAIACRPALIAAVIAGLI